MLDLNWIRKNPAALTLLMKRRHMEPLSTSILDIDEQYRSLQTQQQSLQAQRNSTSKMIGEAKRTGSNAEEAIAKVAQIKEQIKELDIQQNTVQEQLNNLLYSLPNQLLDDVPEGVSEDNNQEIRRVGDIPSFTFTPLEHFSLAENLRSHSSVQAMDFERGASLAGARFVVLSGPLARLERAIGQYMVDVQTQSNGYTEVSVPVLVRDNVLFGSGQLPKFTEDLFMVGSDHYLIPTSEAPLVNLVADQILAEDQLPLRFTALTPCFRSEAGAAGRDTRGMIRQHQFNKVEMVSITTPETSLDELERMTNCAEQILQGLELPYRVMKLCTADIGFSAQKTYDIEVWLPGRSVYREISSCSVCGDFQARRMKARFRTKKTKETQFVHTLNGSGLAVGRTLIAVLENYQNQDGSVTIPNVLRSYMGGISKIETV